VSFAAIQLTLGSFQTTNQTKNAHQRTLHRSPKPTPKMGQFDRAAGTVWDSF
jgi:hypothetical protein